MKEFSLSFVSCLVEKQLRPFPADNSKALFREKLFSLFSAIKLTNRFGGISIHYRLEDELRVWCRLELNRLPGCRNILQCQAPAVFSDTAVNVSEIYSTHDTCWLREASDYHN